MGRSNNVKLKKKLKPSQCKKYLKKTENKTHKEFHSKKSVKAKKDQAEETTAQAIESGSSGKRPRESTVECEKKKALVIIGNLTGNPIADAAFKNTAAEAVSDFTDRGYETTLLDKPTNKQIKAFLVDPCVKAFAYVGHGSDSDSDDAKVGGKGGGDFIWPNADEVMTSSEVRHVMNGGTMDVVILHACFQGASNTTTRWTTAFGVGADDFHSWSGLCRYFTAYWWQFGWD